MTRGSLDYSRQAQKDAQQLRASGLKPRAQRVLEITVEGPFATPPRLEDLVGDRAGCYSRRIDIQHRLVYEVLPDEQTVHVLCMYTHYVQSRTDASPEPARALERTRHAYSFKPDDRRR